MSQAAKCHFVTVESGVVFVNPSFLKLVLIILFVPNVVSEEEIFSCVSQML